MSVDIKSDPVLHEIIGALILGSERPVSAREIARICESVAQEQRAEAGEDAAVTDDELLALDQTNNDAASAGKTAEAVSDSDVTGAGDGVSEQSETVFREKQIREGFLRLQELVRQAGVGMEVVEVSGGYRIQTAPDCARWVRQMLNRGKPKQLSRPMIETLAIIAYRQPIARSEIESIRGVGVGHVIKSLMEMQLVRIIGRSDLPGRPFLFGTTSTFLEHFGLKNLNELNELQPGVERTPPAEQRARHIKKKPEETDTAGMSAKKSEADGQGTVILKEKPDTAGQGDTGDPLILTTEVKENEP